MYVQYVLYRVKIYTQSLVIMDCVITIYSMASKVRRTIFHAERIDFRGIFDCPRTVINYEEGVPYLKLW